MYFQISFTNEMPCLLRPTQAKYGSTIFILLQLQEKKKKKTIIAEQKTQLILDKDTCGIFIRGAHSFIYKELIFL